MELYRVKYVTRDSDEVIAMGGRDHRDVLAAIEEARAYTREDLEVYGDITSMMTGRIQSRYAGGEMVTSKRSLPPAYHR